MKSAPYIVLVLFLKIHLCLANPPRIEDLSGVPTNGGVYLRWTSPVPTDATTITNIDVRTSTRPINSLNFSRQSRVDWLVDPGTAGTVQTAIIPGLTPGTTNYIAIKSQASDGSWSTISNLAVVVAGDSTYTIRLLWDAVADESVGGYRLYMGTISGDYSDSIDVGNTTSGTFTNLTFGILYYYAVKAYDTNGVSSEFSNEISYSRP